MKPSFTQHALFCDALRIYAAGRAKVHPAYSHICLLLLFIASLQPTYAQAPAINYTPGYMSVQVGTSFSNGVNNTGGFVPGHYLGAVSTFIDSDKAGTYPAGITKDIYGYYYIPEYTVNKVRKVDGNGNLVAIYGSGNSSFADGSNPATVAFHAPIAVCADNMGNVFVSDFYNGRVRKINSSGVVSTLVSGLNQPNGMAYEAATRTLYLAEYGGNRIRKIVLTASATLLSNTIFVGSTTGAMGTATDVWGTSTPCFNSPTDVARDPAGNLYVADQNNQRIMKVTTPGGYVTTYAGAVGVKAYADGWSTNAHFSSPTAVSTDNYGNVYVSDKDNGRIRMILPDGTVSTLAGNGMGGNTDASDGLQASFSYQGLYHMYNDDNGTMLLADMYDSKIRKFNYTGYSVSPAPTNGVSMDQYGVFTGTPVSASDPVTYTVTGANDWGRSVATFTISAYNPAPTLSAFADITVTYGAAPFTITQPSSNSSGGFSYGSSNNGVASVSGNTLYINGAGTTTITAYQDADATYTAGSISMTLTVNKANPTLYGFGNISKTYGDPAFNLYSPGTNSTGSFSYTISDGSIASVSGPTVTPLNAGVATITAHQAADNNYHASSITATLTVNKATPVLSAFNNITKTYGDAPFALSAPATNSPGSFVYSSSNGGVATNSVGTITITGAGATTITASQEATANFNTGSINATLTVLKANPNIGALNLPAKNYGDAPFAITHPTSNSTGTFAYTTSNASVATVSGNTITITGAGTATITATQAGDANYNSGSVSATLTVSKINPTIQPWSLPTKAYAEPPFVPTAPVSNSTGGWTYTSSNAGVATVSGGFITLAGAGASIITATQAADNNFNSATVSAVLTVVKGTPTITGFNNLYKTYGDAAFTMPAPSSNSTGALSYTSSTPAVAAITGNTIAIHAAGVTTITLTQAGDVNFNEATATITLTVNKAIPVLGTLNLPLVTYGDNAFSLAQPTSNSPGTFSYASSNPAVASISGTTVNIAGAGLITITATQAETANYLSASVSAPLTVNKAVPALGALGDVIKTYGDAPFTLVQPTTNSSGAFSYTSSNPAVAIISGTTVTIRGAGTATITAAQAADGNYLAGSVTATLTVNKAVPQFSGFADINKVYTNPPFSMAAPVTNSTGAISYSSSNTAVATLAGDEATIRGAGVSTITATLAPDNNYLSATLTATLTVAKADPSLSGFADLVKTYNDGPFILTAPVTNSTGAFSYTSANSGVATVSSSTVTVEGAGVTTITATQAGDANFNSGTITAQLTVNKDVPELADFFDISKVYGDAPFALFGPTTNSTGAITYTISNPAVATIAGSVVTIRGAGVATITATLASDANYGSRTIQARLTVGKGLPVIAGFDNLTVTYGDAPFTLATPTSSGMGSFSYSSSNNSVATVTNNVVTITGAGNAILSAHQGGDANHNTASVTAILTVRKADPGLADFHDMERTYGDAPFSVVAPATNSTGAITYTSSNTRVATVSGGAITIVGAGTTTITAIQAADANYLRATIPAQLVVYKAVPQLSGFTDMIKTYGDGSFVLQRPATNSTGAFTFSSSEVGVATTLGATATLTGAGVTTISATQAADDNFEEGLITAQLLVNKAVPMLGSFPALNKAYGDLSFRLTPPLSASTGGFSYTSSDMGVATIAGDVVTITGVGTTVITAVQAGDANYLGASTTTTLTVIKGVPHITGFEDITVTYGDAPFSLTTPQSNSNGVFTYTSSNLAVATVRNGVVTIVGAGNAILTANQAVGGNFIAGSATALLVVNKRIPTLGAFADMEKEYEDKPFTLATPQSNSTGAFTYSSSDPSVATIQGDVVTIHGAGTALITATQAADANNMGGSISATLKVHKSVPAIARFADMTKTYGDQPFGLNAPASTATGSFTYVSSDTSVAVVGDNEVRILAAGTTIITAIQGTDANYLSGSVSATLVVNKAQPKLGAFPDVTKTYGDPDFGLVAPRSSSTGAFSFECVHTGVVDVEGTNCAITAAGESLVVVKQAGDANYHPATDTMLVTVNKKELAVRAVDAQRCINAVNPQFSLSYKGFVKGEDTAVLEQQPVAQTKANKQSPAGTYVVELRGGAAANYQFQYEEGLLTVNNPVNKGRSLPPVLAMKNEPIQLAARPIGVKYQWLMPVGLNNSRIEQPVANLERDQVYHIFMTEGGSCVVVDTLLVQVKEKPGVFVPSLFSPNGDGINDQLCYNSFGYKTFRYLRIYNRWGVLVFQSTTLGECWDGRYKGALQPMDSYIYTISAVDKNGKLVSQSGSVTLVR